MRGFIFALFLLCGCSKSPTYMVVLDAGSSGTRVYVYQILDTGSSTAAPNIVKVGTCKYPDPNCKQTGSPDKGISKLGVVSQAVVDAYLQPLISFAKNNLTADQLANTSIYLRSTAGVRNLSPVDLQAGLMNQATITLKNAGFKTGSAVAISGFAEGIYAWIDVNMSLGTLGQPNNKTFGIIEMGGASEQITFIPDEQSNSFPLNIAGKTYALYSFSYGHLGVNDAISTKDSLGKELAGCDVSSGAGDYQTCKSSWAALLNQNFACKPLCGLEGSPQPIIPLSMSFKMLGGAPGGILAGCPLGSYYQASVIDANGQDICKSASFCSKYTLEKNKPYLCKLVALLSTELAGNGSSFKGFGFAQNSTQVEPVDSDGTINGQEVTWTRGFVVGELLGIAPDQ